MSGFEWLGQIIEAILKFFPRVIIIRATHGGVKWLRGWKVKELKPGLHVYWPLFSDVDTIVTARQTTAIPEQVLTTKDGRRVVVKALTVYRIPSVVAAIGERNWDVDTSVADIASAAVVHVIATHTYDEIMTGISDETLPRSLTKAVRKALRPFGVAISKCLLVDFAECQVYKLMNGSGGPQHAVPLAH